MRIEIIMTIDVYHDWEKIHITDNMGHSCDYGDGNYDKGITFKGITRCFDDFIKDYIQDKILIEGKER